MDRLAHVIQPNLEFRCCNYLPYVADQSAIDCKTPMRKFSLEEK
jgi:hypothetical protein